MRSAAAAVVLLLACLGASAQELGLAQQRVDLPVHDTRTLSVLGSTAAWPVDPSIVEVVLESGLLQLTGRSAGRTNVVVARRGGESIIEVVVAGRSTAAAASPARAGAGVAEVRYSSAQQELHNSVSVSREGAKGRSELHVDYVRSAAPPDGQPRTTLPTATYRMFSRGRELTILDRVVDHSPLTLSSTAVRGVHFLDDRWRVHAGVTAWSSNRSFLLPVDHEKVAAVAYSFAAGSHGSLTPGLFVYPGQGSVLSMLYGFRPSESLDARAEVAVSRGIGAAARVSYQTERDRAELDVRYRPREFAVVGPGDVRGFLGDGRWNRRWAGGTSAALSFSVTDFANVDQRAMAASGNVDAPLRGPWSVTGGASWGLIGDSRAINVPAGIRVDLPRGSVAATYRWSRNSTTSRGSHGVRLSARTSVGRLRLSAYADRTEDAPTLGVIFREQPDLALALEELGLQVSSPDDVARALREHASLIALGFIEGVTVDLAPLRTQAGIEAAWGGTGPARNQFRARLLHNVSESVSGSVETTIASLTWSRRLSSDTDFFARYSYWKTELRGEEPIVQPFFEAGVRHRFDDIPSLLPRGSGSIQGIVFADENLDGASDGRGLEGAEVELDGLTKIRTGDDGKFEFAAVPRGSHRLTARVPSHPEAYFTTPSRVEVSTGESVSFGVATTPARLLGRVESDAGEGIASVVVTLRRGTTTLNGTTASDGSFSFSSPPGEWTLAVSSDSLPAGYAAGSVAPMTLSLDRSSPRQAVLVVRALRTVTITGAGAGREVTAASLGRKVVTDAEGRAALRSLPAGELVLQAGTIRRSVSLPASPASLTVDFGAAAVNVPATASSTDVPVTRDHGSFVVLLGAFRKAENAAATAAAVRRSGVTPVEISRGDLTLLHAGPFSTRPEAERVAAKLSRSGLEAVVATR